MGLQQQQQQYLKSSKRSALIEDVCGCQCTTPPPRLEHQPVGEARRHDVVPLTLQAVMVNLQRSDALRSIARGSEEEKKGSYTRIDFHNSISPESLGNMHTPRVTDSHEKHFLPPKRKLCFSIMYGLS